MCRLCCDGSSFLPRPTGMRGWRPASPLRCASRRLGTETLLFLIVVVGSVKDDMMVHLMFSSFYVVGFFSIGVTTISAGRAVRRSIVVSAACPLLDILTNTCSCFNDYGFRPRWYCRYPRWVGWHGLSLRPYTQHCSSSPVGTRCATG